MLNHTMWSVDIEFIPRICPASVSDDNTYLMICRPDYV